MEGAGVPSFCNQGFFVTSSFVLQTPEKPLDTTPNTPKHYQDALRISNTTKDLRTPYHRCFRSLHTQVLGKHHEMPAEALVSVASIIKHHMHRTVLSPTQKESVTAFLQQPAGFQSYAPASVAGIQPSGTMQKRKTASLYCSGLKRGPPELPRNTQQYQHC